MPTSDINVISTTSADANSRTNNSVYIKFGSSSANYQLKNTLTGNFTNGATDNFIMLQLVITYQYLIYCNLVC